MIRKEGINEGIVQSKKEKVLKLYNDKFSIGDIIKYTDLSEKEIKNIIY